MCVGDVFACIWGGIVVHVGTGCACLFVRCVSQFVQLILYWLRTHKHKKYKHFQREGKIQSKSVKIH